MRSRVRKHSAAAKAFHAMTTLERDTIGFFNLGFTCFSSSLAISRFEPISNTGKVNRRRFETLRGISPRDVMG